MAQFLKALGLGSRSEEREIAESLNRIGRRRVALFMEIEQSQVHFRSVMSVKRGVVVVAKPTGLGPQLKKESFIRFTLPGEEGKDVRMQVISPHFNLTSGNAVFLCRLPTEYTESTKRQNMRFNTSRFKNLHLIVDNTRRFRIIDLSTTGFKIYVAQEIAQHFPLGKPIRQASINISKYDAELEVIVPRVHIGKTVGCQMTYPQDGSAKKYIEHLITSLQKTEEENLTGASL